VIHLATVHWNDSRWIDIQQRYFHAHLSEQFRGYAFINGIEDICAQREKFFYVSTEPIADHAIKLNILADIIIAYSRDDSDLLIFVDGDAFPIGDIVAFARASLAKFPLLAVQRLENNGDSQPHPCFCVTTVGFWRQLGGDWKAGYHWKNPQGEMVTDVGGNLLGQLERAGTNWLPLHRSNLVNRHALWFGVYADLVYHHGASFRQEVSCRLDERSALDIRTLTFHERMQTKIANRLSRHLGLKATDRFNPIVRRFRAMLQRNRELNSEMLEILEQDPFFYHKLIGQVARPAKD
jgi:hypothetical protein